MRIKFTSDAVLQTEGPGKGPKFLAGEVYDCRQDFGERWLIRQKAEAVEGDFAEPKPPTAWVKVEPPKAAAEPEPAAPPPSPPPPAPGGRK